MTVPDLGMALLDAPGGMVDDDSDGGSEFIMTDEDDGSSIALSDWVAKSQPSMVVLADGKGQGLLCWTWTCRTCAKAPPLSSRSSGIDGT